MSPSCRVAELPGRRVARSPGLIYDMVDLETKGCDECKSDALARPIFDDLINTIRPVSNRMKETFESNSLNHTIYLEIWHKTLVLLYLTGE